MKTQQIQIQSKQLVSVLIVNFLNFHIYHIFSGKMRKLKKGKLVRLISLIFSELGNWFAAMFLKMASGWRESFSFSYVFIFDKRPSCRMRKKYYKVLYCLAYLFHKEENFYCYNLGKKAINDIISSLEKEYINFFFLTRDINKNW